MVKNVYILFLIGLLLVASHNADNIILYGFDPFPVIITLPYIVIALIWRFVPKLAIALILSFFTVIELNHTITEHFPNLIENGLNRQTFSALLYDLGLIVWVVTLFILFKNLFTGLILRKQKNSSLSK